MRGLRRFGTYARLHGVGMLVGMKGHIQTLGMAAVFCLLAGCATRRAVIIQPASGPSQPSYAAAPRRVIGPAGSYRVEKGDTLYSIAFRHGLDFRDVARWNGIDAPYTIWPGQLLTLHQPAGRWRPSPAPPVRREAPAPVVRVPPAASSAPTIVQAPAHASTVIANEVPVAGVPPAVPPPPPPAPPTAAPGGARSVSGISWRWPADGTVIKRFQSGDAIPGIEIAGRGGSPVRAAADGVVVYSGDGLVGYGELIIVKHNDDFLSAYGHNRKRLVKEGQRVSAGQEIAEMGSTGASRDELQFQIRRNGNPVNPLDYLPSR